MREGRQVLIFGVVVLLTVCMTACRETTQGSSADTPHPAAKGEQAENANRVRPAQEKFPISPFSGIFEGELTGVDTTAKTLSVETSRQMEFRYDDQTETSGTESGIAGLAPESRVRVRVYFDAASMTASKIEIQQQE